MCVFILGILYVDLDFRFINVGSEVWLSHLTARSPFDPPPLECCKLVGVATLEILEAKLGLTPGMLEVDLCLHLRTVKG